MDNQLLEHLLSFLTERRKNLFEEVISKRTRHFTVVTEDVYQMHNTSAVMRSCDVFGIQELHVIEEKISKMNTGIRIFETDEKEKIYYQIQRGSIRIIDDKRGKRNNSKRSV
mgnify:CR=1 FL=1